MIILIWTCVLAACLVLFFKKKYSKFKDNDVNNLPTTPPLGNLTNSIFRKQHATTIIKKLYDAFPEDRFVGHFEFWHPVVMIRDLELIKRITLKDFDHFVDHRIMIDENNDKLFGKNLFALKGSKWRDMRSTLSPAFTSSKIRLMVPFMLEVGEQMNEVLKQKIKATGTNSLDVEVRDLTTRYANDVIATCAFGVKVNSHLEEDNEFYINGKASVNFDSLLILKIIAFSTIPKLMNALKISLMGETVENFFRNLVTGVMKDREEHNIIRPDMIHLLMEAKKGSLTHDETPSEDAGFATVEESNVGKNKTTRVWTDDDLIAQAVLFFIAGFDSVSTAMTFLLFELALNPDVQNKLVEEIRQVDAKSNGKLDYNSIQKMEYLDMVVSETLRLWSPALALDRVCVNDCNLGKANCKSTKDYIVRKGEGIIIPVWGIHRNPKYFPNPDKFDPERFSAANRHNITPYSYIPFGLGPRNCIASRFALCEVKVMVFQLLRDMEVLPSMKNPSAIELDTKELAFRILGGAWLKFKVRS